MTDKGYLQISELKDFFQNNSDQDGPPGPPSTTLEPDESEIIFGHCKYITKQEILATVPPRPIVDRLIAGFLNFDSMASGWSLFAVLLYIQLT
jgi:hypothetical protein